MTMAYEFKFPDVGEGIHEGEIVRWRVNVGDEVKEDQPLVEVETAKAIVELPAPRTGVVLARLGNEGQTIHVGDLLVAIGDKGEQYAPQTATTPGAQVSGAGAGGPSAAAPGVVGSIPTEEKGVVLPGRTGAAVHATPGTPHVLPRIRKLAGDLGIDLASIKASGPGGQITEGDVRSAASQKTGGAAGGQNAGTALPKHPDYAQWGVVEKTPLKGIRKAIADHMALSKATIPHVIHMDEFDATNLVTTRKAAIAAAGQNPAALVNGQPVKITYLAFIIKAAAESLKMHPAVNSVLNEATQEIIAKKYYNIAVAVDTPEGLMAPVIKNADTKDSITIAKEIIELAEKCRARTISPRELEGATFTITNIGSVGGTYATPIIPVGQSAILGLYRMKDRPVAENGAVVIRPIMTLSLSYDHRVVDGAEGARFMNTLIEKLQTPEPSHNE